MLWIAMTTLEKLEMVPARFWVNAVLLILAGVLAIVLLRHASHMHRGLLTLIILLMGSTLCFQWIYQRNEPRFFTPMANKIAPYFPLQGRSHF